MHAKKDAEVSGSQMPVRTALAMFQHPFRAARINSEKKKARRLGKGIEIQKGKFAAEMKANQRGLKESESVGRERTKQSR